MFKIMYNNNNKNNEVDDTAESEDEDIGVGSSKQNKTIIIIVSAILASAAVYFFVLKEPEDTSTSTIQQSNEIVVSDDGVQPLTNEQVDYNVTDILDTVPDTNLDTKSTQSTVPALPEIPQLPDSIRQQISDNISAQNNPKKEESPKIQTETYTKEEVNKMIEDRMKELLVQQKENNNANSDNNINTPQKILPNKNDSSDVSAVDLLNKGNENSSLSKIQKNQALAERRGAPMFSMSGGIGPANSLPQDNDAIILTYSDSKLEVPTKAPDVMPTQITDLTRTILQGKIINAALETAIDTDIASDIRAVITRDVFAEEGKNILIPKGSRIIGTYSTNVSAGQTRVTINWNRIIRVDGMSLNITSIGADRLGRAGVQGEVDNKYAQRLANTFLSSVLSVGTSLAVEKMSGSTGISSTVSSLTGETTTTTGKASDYALVDATQNLMDEAKNIVDEIANQRPVIRIPQGEKITIMVTQDVTLPVFKKGN